MTFKISWGPLVIHQSENYKDDFQDLLRSSGDTSIRKLQGWLSRSLEVLWWYINPKTTRMTFKISWGPLVIHQSENYKDDFQDLLRSSGDTSIHIQIYSWSFSWNNERSFFYQSTSIIHDNLMFSKLTYLPQTDMDWIRYLTKPSNSGTYFLKTSNHLRH